MALDYAKLAATATRLITENGRAVTLRRSSATPADPTKPWGVKQSDAVADDDESVETTALFLEPNRGEEPLSENFLTTRPTTTLLSGAARVFVPETTDVSAVGPGWFVVDGARRLDVLAVQSIKPGGTVVYHELQVRS